MIKTLKLLILLIITLFLSLFLYAYAACNSYNLSVKNNKYGLTDSSGKIILNFEYDKILISKEVENTVLIATKKNNKYHAYKYQYKTSDKPLTELSSDDYDDIKIVAINGYDALLANKNNKKLVLGYSLYGYCDYDTVDDIDLNSGIYRVDTTYGIFYYNETNKFNCLSPRTAYRKISKVGNTPYYAVQNFMEDYNMQLIKSEDYTQIILDNFDEITPYQAGVFVKKGGKKGYYDINADKTFEVGSGNKILQKESKIDRTEKVLHADDKVFLFLLTPVFDTFFNFYQ